MDLTPKEQAEQHRPPQPEWQDGDLALDRFGGLWRLDGRKWHARGIERSTTSLIQIGGPIHKVHIADPAKHEVVVSLDGVNLDLLAEWADDDGSDGYSYKVTVRVAKAARKQLGGVAVINVNAQAEPVDD